MSGGTAGPRHGGTRKTRFFLKDFKRGNCTCRPIEGIVCRPIEVEFATMLPPPFFLRGGLFVLFIFPSCAGILVMIAVCYC